MNDLQKDQAIYQAMCEIAEKYFSRAIESNEQFRKFMSEKTIISVKELEKDSNWYAARRDIVFDDEEITVDTFSCRFRGDNVFNLMQQFKSLAKAKGDYFFTYEEEIPNDYIGSVDITFDNPANAKNLANHLSEDELRPNLNHVLLEVNAATCDINFVACDGHVLGVIANNTENITAVPEDGSKVYQSLFTKTDWKRICDYARKMKSPVRFELYKRTEDELQDTMFAVLGDAKIRSVVLQGAYPNWRSVLQKDADKHFAIHPDDVKAAQAFVKGLKVSGSYERERQSVNVSFYRGSDIMYFDYYDSYTETSKTASFRLTEPSTMTIGTNYNIYRLQKVKFTGFNLEDAGHGSVIDCEEADYMLVMPMLSERGYVFNVNEREVLDEVEVLEPETAKVVELAVAA